MPDIDLSSLYGRMHPDVAQAFFEAYEYSIGAHNHDTLKEVYEGFKKNNPNMIASLADYKFVASVAFADPVQMILRAFTLIEDMRKAENLEELAAVAYTHITFFAFIGYSINLAEQKYNEISKRPEPTELE